jgi:hypothetical protein
VLSAPSARLRACRQVPPKKLQIVLYIVRGTEDSCHQPPGAVIVVDCLPGFEALNVNDSSRLVLGIRNCCPGRRGSYGVQH